MTLSVTLSKDRKILGTIESRSDAGRIGGPWECYGKSDNAKAAAQGNPTRNPLKKFGDTPTGTYSLTLAGQPQADTRTFGPHPVIMMEAKSGQCLDAVSKGGRAGIWLHGGHLNGVGKLRPTYGCLRVHNATMVEIIALVKQFGPLEEMIVKENTNV